MVNAMIFKVDFEKDFDSVRWDYLDDVLQSFGFGEKWRSWITYCLDSAMGSVLVNVMESLHLSFNRVLDSGLYKGISINASLTFSHLFYADDAVFVAIPLYHMSLFKVRVGTLNSMESIRRNFFHGVERSERKMAWIGSSLWSRFIKAIHGVIGAFDNHNSTNRNFIWLDIVHDLSSLNRKGIDLLALVRKKVGNGENSLFWDGIWFGDVALKNQYPRLYALDLCSGEFSVKSVRNLIDDTLLPKSDVPTRWVKLIPIKVNILAWRIRLDR
ncbi:hypothetical protein Tco_0302574 [Tanacetum coccineum]